MKAKFFSLVFGLIACAGTLLAWDYERVQIDGLYYNLDATNKTAEVADCDCRGYHEDEMIVNMVHSVSYKNTEYSVKSIGDEAFIECENLTSIEIPNSITNIGDGAFYDCERMDSPGHRENILTAYYTYLGCGAAFYYEDSSIYVKATQNFVKK